MKRVVVTGGSGLAGKAVLAELQQHGYELLNVDRVLPKAPLCDFMKVDLTDLGQTLEALRGASAVVHLAAIPGPGLCSDELTFRVNVTSTYNVFSAVLALNLERVVWASSETVLGLPFDPDRLAYAPVDEQHPLFPQTSYALSKVVGEAMAQEFSRWSGRPFIGLRFSGIVDPAKYGDLEPLRNDVRSLSANLWSYVDARDVARACHLALQVDLEDAHVFIIAAADTIMDRPSRELMNEVFPDVKVADSVRGFDSLLSTARARAMLQYSPLYSWRPAGKSREGDQ